MSASYGSCTGTLLICWANIADVLWEFCAELYNEDLSSFLLINDLNVWERGFPDF